MQYLAMTPGNNAGKNIYYSHVRGQHHLAKASLMLGFGSQQGSETGERALHRKEARVRTAGTPCYGTPCLTDTLTR